MFDNPLAQFILELVRALLVDELSGRVRRPLARLRCLRGERGCRPIILKIHRRNRDRLLHRLLTEQDEDL